MQRARIFWVFVLAAVLVLPGMARAQTVVGLYPVQGKLDAKVLGDVTGLIVSGIRDSDRQRGAFILRGPVPLQAACAPKVTTACLAGQARGGAILYAEAVMGSDGLVSVTMTLVTGKQQQTRPVSFRFLPALLDSRPANYAIAQLEKALAEAGPAPIAEGAVPLPPPEAPRKAEAARPVPQPQPVAAAARPAGDEADLLDVDPELSSGSPYDAPAPKPSGWMRKTGIYTAIGGALVLGAGGFFGLQSRGLNKDLSSRYAEGRLVPADRLKYSQVKTYNTLANTLLIGGGVAALTGLTFWGLSYVSFESDGRGGGINVRGRF